MKTEALIEALAADTKIERPILGTLVLWLVPAIALAAMAIHLVLGFRDDLLMSLFTPLSARSCRHLANTILSMS